MSCRCDLDDKFCSKILPFCYQKLIDDEWVCQTQSSKVWPEEEKPIALPDEAWVPKIRVLPKGLPYHKIYKPPALLSPIPEFGSRKRIVIDSDDSDDPDVPKEIDDCGHCDGRGKV